MTGRPVLWDQMRAWAVRVPIYGLPALLIALPLLGFLSFGFWAVRGNAIVYEPSVANYVEFWTNPVYRRVFVRSFFLSGNVALIGLLLGYLVAYCIWRLEGRLRFAMLLLTAVPLAMNYVVKIYAMRGILGYGGYLNWMLVSIGVIDEPSRLFLYNQTAVLITMAVIYLPYAIFPIFLALERVSPSLIAAADDLGAPPVRVFTTVVLPLSAPGAVVGALFVMVLALGDFLTPQMVGGIQGVTFGSVVWSQFGLAFNWPLGAALATMLLLATIAIIGLGGLISASGKAR